MTKGIPFDLQTDLTPNGDQPKAIAQLVENLSCNVQNQILLGVTGSGKTFSMANVIQKTQKPALVMAHNKTLAAQLYGEFKTFFPNNAVEYFISFFDYYQPEAYLPSSDVYIDKDSQINAKLEQLKHSTIYSLMERKDVIIVASVSAIYGIGERQFYEDSKLKLEIGMQIPIINLSLKLAELHYTRNDISFDRGTFRVLGDIVEIFPANFDDSAIRLSFFGDEIETIDFIDPLTRESIESLKFFRLYAATLYSTPKEIIAQAIVKIKEELEQRITFFTEQNKLIEAQRIKEKVNFDIEMLQTTGYCKGIENYIRYLGNRSPNSVPSTLFDYLPENILLFIDESHVSVPQIRGMYNADRSRKQTLVDYGFRLPSCLDNRPLTFDEWDTFPMSRIFISATPGEFELNNTKGQIIEQLIRPTGLLDPICIVKPTTNQIDDLILEARNTVNKGFRVLVTALTKKIAEQITDYLNDNDINSKYLHSDIDSLERIQIIKQLREGTINVIVGINLLREGLDIPECALVAILDADKEGFLRSKTSLVQTIGRAARNSQSKVILYADKMTQSLEYAIYETSRRRKIQSDWNQKYNITPTTVKSKITEVSLENKDYTALKNTIHTLYKQQKKPNIVINVAELDKQKKILTEKMYKAAENLMFEDAIKYRNQIKQIDLLILQ